MTHRNRHSLFAALVAVALVTGAVAPTAEAALARPPVVQRDVNNRAMLEVSADGRYALTGNLINSMANKRIDLVTKAAAAMNFEAINPHLLANGSAVIFESSQKLVASDTNGLTDVYRYTFSTKAFARIVPANAPSAWDQLDLRDISADGKVIAFFGSSAVFAQAGIWIYDVVAKTWRRPDAVIPTSAGLRRESFEVSLSASGRIAAVTSFTLAGGPSQVWLYNWGTNKASLVSVKTNGATPPGNCTSNTPDVTPDGAFVSFRSTCGGLVAGLTAVKPRVFVRGRLTKVTRFVTDKEAVGLGPDLAVPGAYHGPQLGANGTMLVLLEDRPTTLGVDRIITTQPVLYRISTRENVVLTKPAGTALPNNFARNVFISGAGKRAVFTSQATNFTTVSRPSDPDTDRAFASTLP